MKNNLKKLSATLFCAAFAAAIFAQSQGATIDMSDSNPPASGANWTYASGVYTINNDANVTVTGNNAGSQRRIAIAQAAAASITLDNTTIAGLGNRQSPILLNDGANLTLTLVGENFLTAEISCAGIQAAACKTLTIPACATLTNNGTITPADGSAIIIDGFVCLYQTRDRRH